MNRSRTLAAQLLLATLLAFCAITRANPVHAEGFAGLMLSAGKNGGVWVRGVVPRSEADREEVQPGWQLTALDDAPVTTAAAVEARIARTANRRMRFRFVDKRFPLRQHLVELTPFERPQSESLLRALLVGRYAQRFGRASTAVADIDPHSSVGLNKLRVLYFWSSHCPPCRAGVAYMSALASRYAAFGVEVLGPTYERAAVAEARALAWGAQFEIVPLTPLDIEHSGAGDDYFISAYPTTVIVDRNDVIRNVWIGSPPIEELTRAVDDLLAAPRDIVPGDIAPPASLGVFGYAFNVGLEVSHGAAALGQ
jgi:thiol-disulfide isomerase/thioredoxin